MSNSNEAVTMTADTRFAFKRGWGQLKKKDAAAARAEIMIELGLNHRNGFYKRMNGEVIPRVTEVEAIERIFKKYGVTKIWGVEP